MEPLNLFQESFKDVTCTHRSGYADVTTHYHKHDNYEIYLLLNGEVNFHLEQQGYHMKKGSLLFMRPDVFHRLEYLDSSSYERINIHINTYYFRTLNTVRTDLSNVLSARGNGSFVSFHLPQPQIDDLVDKSRALENSLQWGRFGDDILSECLLKEILLMLNRLPQNKKLMQEPTIFAPPIVTDLISYIHKNLTGDLSIQTLAVIFHHNGQYMSRRFREAMGIPLQQYIIHKRIDLARKYLREGYPLTKACFASGFHDYSNFSKTFTKYAGASPKQYQLQSMTIS